MAQAQTPTPLDRALIEEAAKKSGLLWVRGEDAGPAVGLWYLWIDGAVCLVGGPGEQPLRGLTDGGTAVVTLRSKDKGGRLVAFPARVAELAPHSDSWQAAVGELKGKRLNAPDFADMPERWARTCRVLRLTPDGAPVESPTVIPTGSGAAAPPPTPATTRHPIPRSLPRLLLRRRRAED
ncbi:hypothetical protein POF50_013965 [Streptomyces sp. SL13]|uniref:Uncharacterized protein n=1 Tax=Streptantibioticus silvisoli TaxID=2705255 RepID=A0AA90GZF2_9ACTN|nr:hypothetical protein [Streptantibioticus silvisoli]MDI5963885.1 hypothetical protein [Streptantibioticus silvisoli]MDI5970434.1 hypothetical protein [Streptantibioticus silvisoli]